MAKLRWRVEFESLWRDELPALAHRSIEGYTGKDRIKVVKGREAAQALLKSLFPEDEPDGKPRT